MRDANGRYTLPEYVAQHLHPYYAAVLRPLVLGAQIEKCANPRADELLETLKYVTFNNSIECREALFAFCGKRIDSFWLAVEDFYSNFSAVAQATPCLRFCVEAIETTTEETEAETQIDPDFDLQTFLAESMLKEAQAGSLAFKVRILDGAKGSNQEIRARVTFCFVLSAKMAEMLFKKEEPLSKGSKRRATMAGMSSGGSSGFAGVLSPTNCNVSGFLDSDARGLCSEKKRTSFQEKTWVEKAVADAISRKAILTVITEIEEHDEKNLEGSLKLLEKLRAII